MSNYVNLQGNPGDMAVTGANLKAAAASLKSEAERILHDIHAIENRKPWGDDEAGLAFEARYHQTPEGDPHGKPFNQSLHDELTKAGEPLDRAGDGIMSAMMGYLTTDGGAASDIDALGA